MFLLWVFAIALTPWSSLHHHEEEKEYCIEGGKICMHKSHIGNKIHNCLICSAHFEKNYVASNVLYLAVCESKIIVRNHPLFSTTYTALISLALRGPPVA